MNTIKGTFQITNQAFTLHTDDDLSLTYYRKVDSIKLKNSTLYLLFHQQLLSDVLLSVDGRTENLDEIVELTLPKDIDNQYVWRYFKNLTSQSSEETIPAQFLPLLREYKENVLTFLAYFHLYLPENKPKKVSAKAQHRFTKELSTIPFYVDNYDSKATIYWEKRNAFKILKGAKLKKDIPLKNDGEIGLSAKMGLQLREEQKDHIRDYTTTEDIYLKSVNEIGLFLYFGQTNSWLVLKDTDGKTIHDYSVV